MSSSSNETYRLPPAWAPHARCWMAWPPSAEPADGGGEDFRACVADVATAIADFEAVTLLANPGEVADASLTSGSKVSTLPMEHEVETLGNLGFALLMTEGAATPGLAAEHGGAGQGLDENSPFLAQLLEHMQLSGREIDQLKFDPACLEVDGEGTALVSSHHFDAAVKGGKDGRRAVEESLLEEAGVEKVVWLDDGEEETRALGLERKLVRFAQPGVVLVPLLHDSGDRMAPLLREVLSRLKVAQDAKGRDLEVIEVGLPASLKAGGDERALRSYLDFHIANDGLVMPLFEEAEDDPAFEALTRAFPGREITQVRMPDIVVLAGGIDALTLVQPKAGD